MNQRLLVINGCLFLTALLFFFLAIRTWQEPETLRPKPSGAASVTEEALLTATTRTKKESAYDDIPQMNLFSESRMEPDLLEEDSIPAGEVTREIPSGQILMYGVIERNNEKKALIRNPAKKHKDDGDFIWVRAGDRIANYTVSNIFSDKMVFADKGKKYSVEMYKKKKSSGGSRKATSSGPTVISTTTEKKKAPAAQSVPPPKKSGEGGAEYKWIDTPFGKKRVKVNAK